jgi:protein-S-isoprenylcysteine O-methyltransferase Ste14
MLSFRSAKKVLGRDPGTLTVSGPYGWSRNPQYVGWLLFLLGFAVVGWTWRCWIALAMLVAALHVLVRTEEEHLEHVFGPSYRSYRARVPRWLGRGRRPDAGSRD